MGRGRAFVKSNITPERRLRHPAVEAILEATP